MDNKDLLIPIKMDEMTTLKEFIDNYTLFAKHVLDTKNINTSIPDDLSSIQEMNPLQQWFLTLSASGKLMDKLIQILNQHPEYFDFMIED